MPLTIPPISNANQISFTSGNGLTSTNVNSGIDEVYSKAAKLASDNTLTGILSLTNSTVANSTGSGAAVITGGLGVGGATYTTTLRVTGGANPSNTTTGAAVITGGLGIGGDIYLGGLSTSGRLRLRGYYIWIDANGVLRYKSSAPTSDTDGTAINDFESWQTPTFFNSFTASASLQTTQYRKNLLGDVEIRGAVARSSVPSSGNAIFTLPSGYRPSAQVNFCVPYIGNSGEGIARISVTPAGNVQWENSIVTPASLTSITYIFLQFKFSIL